MKHLGLLFLLIILGMATAVACNLIETAEVVTLPPTTTPILQPQETTVGRPEPPSTPTQPTITITPTATITITVRTYVIQPGDTLATISSRFEVTVEELAEVNNLANPNAISAGQTLIIPEDVSVTAVPTQILSPIEETARSHTATAPSIGISTDTPEPTATPTSESEAEDEGTAVPPEELEPTGRLEITHPLAMVVAESGVITVEIIADPELATIGEHEPHITGVVRIDASYNDGQRAYYEQTVELFPLMSAELSAPAFEVFPSGGNNVRLPRVISTTLPAAWTWDIIATTPGEAQVITINLYKESEAESGVPLLTQSISRNIRVLPKGRWSQIVDGLADNVLLLLGTGGPLGLALAYLTYRATRENERLKQEVANYEGQQETASSGGK